MSNRKLRYLVHLLDRIHKNPRVEDMNEALEMIDEVLDQKEMRHVFIVESKDGEKWLPVSVVICKLAKMQEVIDGIIDINQGVADNTRYRRLTSVDQTMAYANRGVPVRGKMDGEPIEW